MLVMDTRVIASTNADLPSLCQAGRFRSDLYYRLSTIEIRVPPLRERLSDIPRLVDHFLQREGLPVRFSANALDALMDYSWPGNVRQLRNIILRLGINGGGQTIGADKICAALHADRASLPQAADVPPPASPPSSSRGGRMEALERSAIESTLAECGWNQTEAARRLGMGRTTLYRKLKKYGLARP